MKNILKKYDNEVQTHSYCNMLQDLEKKRLDFLALFPATAIQNMPIESYVLGKGRQTFCYLLEHYLNDYGCILGSTSFKFGVYYGKTKQDKHMKYRFSHKFGDTPLVAFNKVKQEIVQLLNAGKSLDETTINLSMLSPMIRNKILFIYYPNYFLPIYADSHLDYFLKCLQISNSFANSLEKQKALLLWKNNDSISQIWSPLVFSKFLYNTFKKPVKDFQQVEKRADDDLVHKTANISYHHVSTPVIDTPKPIGKQISINGAPVYARDCTVAKQALQQAKFLCEYDNTHDCFIRKKSPVGYTEPHHLIPMCQQNNFQVSIDVEANIISLCSNCHNKIHYGKDYQTILISLYNQRKERLKKAGIDISLTQLVSYYK